MAITRLFVRGDLQPDQTLQLDEEQSRYVGRVLRLRVGDASVAGFTAVSLGPRVLRTETAAIAAVAIAESMWGDLGPR